MINFLLKNPSLYRFYQKTVRAKYDEYDFFKFIFKQNNFKNIRMLDICCGDSYILEYINEFIDDYLGVDNNPKYLENKLTAPSAKGLFFKACLLYIANDVKNLQEL